MRTGVVVLVIGACGRFDFNELAVPDARVLPGTIDHCGDGVVEHDIGETCDDGNQTGGDGCSAACQINENCGNGVVEPMFGEQCDPGGNVFAGGCTPSCVFGFCGDGVLSGSNGEQCDDGDVNGADNICSAACTLSPHFDMSIQDKDDFDYVALDSTTGAYFFHQCSGALTTTGNGMRSIAACFFRVTQNAPALRVTATIDTCNHTGTATVTYVPGATYALSDPDLTNNTDLCP